jgi:Ferritin-like
MSQQAVGQAARRSALDARAVLRKERVDRERRLEGLAVAVLTALGERDAAVQDADKLGEGQLFMGPGVSPGPTKATFRWPDLGPITDLEGANRALERIVEQGEGATGDWATAHYGRFLTMLSDYLAMRNEDPDFEPAYPVVAAGMRGVEGIEPDVYITDPTTGGCSDLFNAVYVLLLQMIARYFAFGHETPEQRKVLAHAAVGLMFQAIKPLGLLLVRLPVGPDHPDVTAGANFQLPYRASFLLPHRRSAWLRFGGSASTSWPTSPLASFRRGKM